MNQYVHGVLRDIVYRCVVLVEGRKKRKNATARDDIADVVYAAKDVLGVKLLADDNATDLTKIGRVGAVDALEQSARYLTNAHDSINSLFESMFGHEVVRRRDVFQSFEKVDNVAGSVRPKPRSMANLGRGQGGKQLRGHHKTKRGADFAEKEKAIVVGVDFSNVQTTRVATNLHGRRNDRFVSVRRTRTVDPTNHSDRSGGNESGDVGVVVVAISTNADHTHGFSNNRR